MKCFYAPAQALHAPATELNRGVLDTPFEAASRPATVLAALSAAGFAPVIEPPRFDDRLIERVHDVHFLRFLQTAHRAWRELGREGDALPMCWPGSTMFPPLPSASLDAWLGHYAFDNMTPITAHSWIAARASADTALAGAQTISDGASSAFSLCRPPGHHAGSASYGGYGFLNTAAIAAQYLRDQGAARIAIFDPDYHHGNGTQQIFYDRADTLYVSIHADPRTDFPFFSGFAHETGAGEGEGCNHNLPLPRGTDWTTWSDALNQAERMIAAFAPDVLVVSLGVDALDGDPLCGFRLKTDDFRRMGARLGRLGLPTLFVMEGGYQLDLVGENIARALRGFLDG
jgi:acetoin utilization deacetylase AcuC-like enzyme